MKFKANAQYDVIGLGASTVDLIHVVDELPGEELVQRAYETSLQGGGPVATAMVALARLGSRAVMVDRLGDDWRGGLILEEFRREGVVADHIQIDPGATSSISTVLVRKGDGARTFVFSPGSSREFEAGEIDANLIDQGKILHLNGRHMAACLQAAHAAHKGGVKVSFDGGAGRYRPALRELLPLVDICIVARQFAFAYTGVEEAGEAAQALLDAGPQLVVVTAGEEGCWVYGRHGRSFHQPAFRIVDVVDTTGAGDAFHGAFLHGLLRDMDLEECARFASAVAGINTRTLGGRAGLPAGEGAVAAFLLAADTV